MEVRAYGVLSQYSSLSPMNIVRRNLLLPNEVRVDILYSGICHSDIHHARNDWGDANYPQVPGHEIIGRVVELGSQVTRFVIGEIVGVGNMIDSCDICNNCLRGEEQYCLNGGPTWTYNGHERYVGNIKTLFPTGALTAGGYSQQVISRDGFVFKIPNSMPIETLAPLLCAGCAVYWPIKYFNIGEGMMVGVAGIGGLGHLGVQMAAARGAMVIALTRNEWKREDCMRMGASDVVIVTDEEDRSRYHNKLDIIISTIPDPHDVNIYFDMIKAGSSPGTLHILGNLNDFPGFQGRNAFFWGKNMTGSNILGVADTQEMIDWCAQAGVIPMVEIINIKNINDAWKSVKEGNVRYRYVIDASTI